MKRPTGITLLAILALIGGLFGLLGGFAAFSMGAVVGALGGTAEQVAAAGLYGMIIGVITLVTAVLDLAFAFGAWGLKPWAWTLGIVVQGLALLSALLNIVLSGDPASAVGGQIIGIVVAAAILYYLFTANVKQAFGKA